MIAYTIGWFVFLLISLACVHDMVGLLRLTQMFPEGRRPWMIWAALGSLALFATLVWANPWGSAFLGK